MVSLIEREMVLPLVQDSVNMPDWNGIYDHLSVQYPQLKGRLKVMVANRKL